MKSLFTVLMVASIISQVPHAYWAIDHFSQIENKALRIVQNVVFCSIISVGIFGFAMIDKDDHALAGAMVEIIINFYYYDKQFKGKGQATMRDKISKNWLAYFLAVLIPMMIYFFALEIKL